MSRALTPFDVRHLFDYNDGRLLWRISIGTRCRIGASAGTQDAKSHTVFIKIDGTKHDRARLVWMHQRGTVPAGFIFHKDRDSSNDRIGNLQDLTLLEYTIARQGDKEHVRLAGTTLARNGKGWQAQIQGAYLGTFKTPEAAHEAYKQAHVAKYGSMSPYAIGIAKPCHGGAEMSESLATTASPLPKSANKCGIFPGKNG